MTKAFDLNDPEWKSWVLSMRQCREDNLVRLAFADWLDDRYGQANAFGALIRAMVDCEAEIPGAVLTPTGWWPDAYLKTPRWGRFEEAAARFRQTWMHWPPLAAMPVPKQPADVITEMVACQWRRGFPERLVLSWDLWMTWCDQVCAVGPVGTVVLTDCPGCHVRRGSTITTFTPVCPVLRARTPEHRHTWCIANRERDLQSYLPDLERAQEVSICNEILRLVFTEKGGTGLVESIGVDEQFLARLNGLPPASPPFPGSPTAARSP